MKGCTLCISTEQDLTVLPHGGGGHCSEVETKVMLCEGGSVVTASLIVYFVAVWQSSHLSHCVWLYLALEEGISACLGFLPGNYALAMNCWEKGTHLKADERFFVVTRKEVSCVDWKGERPTVAVFVTSDGN